VGLAHLMLLGLPSRVQRPLIARLRTSSLGTLASNMSVQSQGNQTMTRAQPATVLQS
jgi:hypothetical protein